MHQEFVKDTDDFNRRAARVMEEAHEVGQAFAKAMRFGWLSSNPLLPKEERETNKEWFMRELKDLENAIEHLNDLFYEEHPAACSCEFCRFWS